MLITTIENQLAVNKNYRKLEIQV